MKGGSHYHLHQQEQEEAENMFAKLQQHHYFQHHHHHHHHHHQEEEGDTRNNNTDTSSGGAFGGGGGGGDGASIEVMRRPRGRPPGSKNKPKPSVLITREVDSSMHPLFLELPGGINIVESIARFTHKKNMGLTILTASGTVTNVSFRQPCTSTSTATVTFHGRFDILSISATFLPPMSPQTLSSFTNPFTISLAGPQGQILGGSVAGPLIAAGSVFIVAASFTTPSYHQLHNQEEEDDDDDEINKSVSTETQSAPIESMYTCHLPTDVIWGAPRQPPPPSF